MSALFVTFILLFLFVHLIFCGLFQGKCQQVCTKNKKFSDQVQGELFCNQDCCKQRCEYGASLYKKAINSSCLAVCTTYSRETASVNGSEVVGRDEISYCIQGCYNALDMYYTRMELQFDNTQPVVISVNYSSLTLMWDAHLQQSVTCKLLKWVVAMDTGWLLHEDAEFETDGQIVVANLQPYVAYKFKVLVLVTSRPEHILESQDTVPVTTLQFGVPSSSPEISSITTASRDVVVVSWRPPPFVNGQLTMYKIYVQTIGEFNQSSTSEEVHGNITTHVLRQLRHSHKYMVSLSAWNSQGEGPKTSKTFTTVGTEDLNVQERPYLVQGTANKIVVRNIADLIPGGSQLPKQSIKKDAIGDKMEYLLKGGNVKGIGLHIKRQLILVCDSAGRITLISKKDQITRYNFYPSIDSARTISVDWLADTAYIASKDKIYSCPLDNDKCFIAVQGLPDTVNDIKVDPINGYLYYVIKGTNQGLYRVSLGSFTKLPTSSNITVSKKKIPAQLVVQMDHVLAYTIDLYNIRLIMINGNDGLMLTSFLDGSNLRPFEAFQADSRFAQLSSLAVHNQTFVWTDSKKLYLEDYNYESKSYQHKELSMSTPPYISLNVLHSNNQQIPIPSNAPENVEAVFTRYNATIKWMTPALLQYQGTGAWNNWTYQLQIEKLNKDSTLNAEVKAYNISGLSLVVHNLQSDHAYKIKIRARSHSGYGPWSSGFIGRTLKDDDLSILMGISGGHIIERNIDSGFEQTVVSIDPEDAGDFNSGYDTEITDIDCYGNIVLYVTGGEDSIFVYDRITHEERKLKTGNIVDSIAYDWLGHKVYWSDLESKMIYRSDIISGMKNETVYQTSAKDLAIDTINARLYWATSYTIETVYLNGDDPKAMFRLPVYSERQITSLSLDTQSGKVFWLERGYRSNELFMVDTINPNTLQTKAPRIKAGEFKSMSRDSRIQFYMQHMFWISEQHSLLIGDSDGNYPANVSQYTNLTAFAVTHSFMHSYLSNVTSTELNVIPRPINYEDIHIEGLWSDFNLTWPPSKDVTHGTVFYKVLVEVGENVIRHVTSKCYIKVSGVSPYSRLLVTIQPYTFWAYAEPTTVFLRSPMSVPSAPMSPEVYIKHHKNITFLVQSLAADFRWMTPKITNGIINHHLLTYWTDEEPETIVMLRNTARHFVLSPIVPSRTYHFKVAACTETGCGLDSDTKTINPNASSEVSTLLVASNQGINMEQLDGDLNASAVLWNISPKAVSFLVQDETRIFWIDTNDEVLESFDSSIQEIVVLNGTGQDLSVDWISRTLYIVVLENNGESGIMQYNIDRRDHSLFLARPAHIDNIIVDPYNSVIIWTELTSEGHGQIMQADIFRKDVWPFLGNNISRFRRSTESCSCPTTLDIAPAIAMSYNNFDGAAEIFFADKNNGAIYSSDARGCQCIKIIEPSSSSSRFGLPPSQLAADPMRVTWYNEAESKLYSISKTYGDDLIIRNITNVLDIQAYGLHLQPLPDSQCLDPKVYNGSTEIAYIGNTSIHLQLPAPVRPAVCQGISSSQFKYTIYYRRIKATKTGVVTDDCHTDLLVCNKQDFYTTDVELTNLSPYTQYLIQIAVSNYYTEYLSEALSAPIVVMTKIGVPGVARNVGVKVFTPEMISVAWRPPLQFNGPPEETVFIIQYSTQTPSGFVQKEVQKMASSEVTKAPLEVYVKNVMPDQFYNITVLTCSRNKTVCSVSNSVQCKTFQTPSNITFVKATAHSLEIKWKPPPINESLRYHSYCAEVKPGKLNWTEVNELRDMNDKREHKNIVTSLKPNTLYAFKLKISYNARPFDKAHYEWPPEETKFAYRTLVYKPEQPLPPNVTRLKSGAYEVKWEEPNDNGAPIINYFLEYSGVEEGTWKTAYNGSLTTWLIESVKIEHEISYVFRVAAFNSEGLSLFSENSTVLKASLAMETSGVNHVTIGVVVGIIAFLAAIFLVIVCVLQKRCEKTKTQQFIIRGPDTELATLRELPHTTFQQSNTLYAINIKCTDEEIAKLPHFGRNQLVLTMFLGSGAFGEVFEGLAKNILGDSTGETKCAVKTLRKSATDHEKEEFLKEALLMKNFQHEHILSLLGVCLDNDPQFIIMELMEGGDLLSFLRSCRATATNPAKLILPDLVKICLHVARGCKYLEDMHFVHRDLAARNCLVSTKSTADMIVKIGDFGLARDIYKNDYYRKEGEGLLPVRWMSPESLVDGFFTTQSDIWAFGVLMWEVVTLGQQPYPARTNIEVLHFVRDRGKLERPDKCTDELYALMSKCWGFHPNTRPCFASLVDFIENYQEKCKQMTSAEIAHWSPSFKNGGGSVRLSQSGKRRRLDDLLGSLDPQETLVVDLTKAGRKRTHSLKDYKHPLHNTSDVADHFPAAGEYDRNGYLEPRGTKGGGRYLELMNYAPELLHLNDPYGNPLFSGNGSAFLPVHVTHKGYHPSNANYTLLASEDDTQDTLSHKSADNYYGSDLYNMDKSRICFESPADQSHGILSKEKSPAHSYDLQHHYSVKTKEEQLEDYYHNSLSPSRRAMVRLSPQRKYSDQDLYFSTAPYRQHRPCSSSASSQDRASIEYNNNRSSTSNGNFSDDNRETSDGSNSGLIRSTQDSMGSLHLCTKPGLGNHVRKNIVGSLDDDSSKASSNRSTWTSNLDNVFIDSGIISDCPNQLGGEVINHHGYPSSKSRGQVFPEINTAVLGYETNQVSLV